MKHWSVDETELKKDKKQYTTWQLEQMVNFGLGEKKLRRSGLKKYWSELHLDPKKKSFLSFLLWGKRVS